MLHHLMRCLLTSLPALLLIASGSQLPADETTTAGLPAPDYTREIAPLLTKYCAGCHSDADRAGDLSLQSYESLRKGTGYGPAVLPGDADASRLIRVLSGGEPAMPPEGEPHPDAEQIALLHRWIDAGAKGPQGAPPDPLMLIVPQVESKNDTRPVTSLDISADGQWRAIARHDQVLLEPLGVQGDAEPRLIGSHPGSVNAVHFVAGDRLLSASGVAGLGGVAALWNVENGELLREFKGHSDILYDAELSGDGTVLATCSYDHVIVLWDAETGRQLRELAGHNGAVYDVAFSPDGRFLVSASADDTCKIWRVSDGERMDTLSQPLQAAYTCSFSPDGQFVVAGGADNRIRIWRFVSQDRPRINPPVHARFAHEGAVLRLAFTPDGSRLVSIAEDHTLKVWETRDYTELKLWENQPDIPSALSIAPDGKSFTLGRLDGSVQSYDIPQQAPATPADQPQQVAAAPMPDMGPLQQQSEVEPNSQVDAAMPIQVPAQISGVIHTPARENEPAPLPDVDLYRFTAEAAQQWVIETDAARSKSPLDSFVEVLDAAGNRIERVRLQAVRDSYFTFRGKNSQQTNDFRVFNWEEMSLDQFFYANGEVVKLWMYPRGPDSGYNVYPGRGTRWTYFDTSGLSHALGEPAYVVEAHPPGSELIPNGLPVFTIFYENDDASRRDIGKDSRLSFTAPADGEYLVKIKDVRGLQGPDFKYTLTVRPRRPDFRVATSLRRKTLAPGSSQEFTVTATRIDGYDGPITVDVAGTLPPGFHVTSPVVIEAGQKEAYGIVRADADAPQPTAQNAKGSRLTASATIFGEVFTHEAGTLGELKLAEKAKLQVAIAPAPGGAQPVSDGEEGPLAFRISPGETIMLQVNVQRHGYDGEVSFGKEFSGRNLPHGAYIDNIGLNGLLLLQGQTQREFFITCDPIVEPGQSRLFHLETAAADGHTSQPVLLHVVGEDRVAGR